MINQDIIDILAFAIGFVGGVLIFKGLRLF